MEFSGKVVFVTAAAGAGIGQAVARSFAREGATVVLSDQHPERTAKVAADIADETGQEVTGVPLDVREEARIDEVINGVADKYGRLDVVVNNSGINMLASLYEMPTDTWRQVLDVSLTGPFMVTRRALNVMRDRGTRGAIVNMSSIAGWMRTGRFTVGDLALFTYYLGWVSSATQFFGGFAAQYRQAGGQVELELFEGESSTPEAVATAGTISMAYNGGSSATMLRGSRPSASGTAPYSRSVRSSSGASISSTGRIQPASSSAELSGLHT